MSEWHPIKILLTETSNPAVRELQAHNPSDLNLVFEPMDLQAAMDLLDAGKVGALVIGSQASSADVIRAGLKTLGTQSGLASSFFIMEKEGHKPLFFADCAVNPSPDPATLAQIAEQTCDNVKRLGSDPVVAFLSFSTEGSAAHRPEVQAVKSAADIFKTNRSDIATYGEVQFDAAWNEAIYDKKTGKHFSHGRPNVFIFPDLNSGNIAYKILEQVAGYVAVGPILQGFRRPLYDLSRGVTYQALTRICQVVAQLHAA